MKFSYNEKILDIIKPIPHKYWNKDLKTWTLPLEHFDELLKELTDNQIAFSVEEVSKICDIWEKHEGIEFKFNFFNNNMDEFQKTIFCTYDKEAKHWKTTCQLADLTSHLNSLKIPFLLHSEESKKKKIFQIKKK